MSKFKNQVLKVVNLIPSGTVASYGQIALYVGIPRAARQVGWILRGLPRNTKVPWWRIVNNIGRISIKHSKYSAMEQKKLLEEEGIEVDSNLQFDIEKYRFHPDEKFIKNLELDPVILDIILEKVGFEKKFVKS